LAAAWAVQLVAKSAHVSEVESVQELAAPLVARKALALE
jgi:hypothetical protein